MEEISFLLSEEDKERIENACHEYGMTIQEFMTTAVEQSLEHYEQGGL